MTAWSPILNSPLVNVVAAITDIADFASNSIVEVDNLITGGAGEEQQGPTQHEQLFPQS
ncbi:MAG TPA: hypothetical protein P5081_07195 [Phycisphaerae bacterium]|nr:hypothetical protein [Phycisphaerae bacterium]HRW52655.1 hypothetical protein [Phycisphaerae bacterium]